MQYVLFFQAEDGVRDIGVTGVQTCALPILQEVLALTDRPVVAAGGIATGSGMAAALAAGASGVWIGTALLSCTEGLNSAAARRSEERRVGEECRSRWPPYP